MSALPPLEITPAQWDIVQGILQRFVPGMAVWAFGSRARWAAKPYSDLDLAVITTEPLGLSVLGALTEAFSESDLPYKVDVVDWASTSEAFRQIVARDKVILQPACASQ